MIIKQFEMRSCLPVEEIGPYMEGWCRKKPGFVTVESIGKSGGYDILKAVFTAPSVRDEEKQVVLLTANHSMELSGVTTLFSVGNFLLSDREEAAKILKNLIVVIIPCSNVYSYSKQDPAYQFQNEAGVCEHFVFRYNGVGCDEATAPAAHAIKREIDKYKPELMIDIHGVCYQDQLVLPVISVQGNPNTCFYNNAFVQQMQKAALEAGYPTWNYDVRERVRQTDLTCQDPEINEYFDSVCKGGEPAQSTTYAYLHYHTLGGIIETAFEKSCVPMIIRAMEIGCETWGGEYYPGYPTRNMVGPHGHSSIRAYGKTAAQRRESREELWRHRSGVRMGVGHPEMPGLSSAIVFTDSFASEKLITRGEEVASVIEKIETRCDVRKDKLMELYSDHYYPHRMDYMPKSDCVVEEGPLELKHGITIRMALPFADARNYEVYYNGFALNEDELDGYTVVKHECWVYIDVHVPAAKICPAGVGIATVKYDCTVPPVGIMGF